MADARDQLRRYLEQRREMGESELVLDTLTVEEALRLIGVQRGGATSSQDAPTRVRETAVTDAPSGSADWREALRASGASPG